MLVFVSTDKASISFRISFGIFAVTCASFFIFLASGIVTGTDPSRSHSKKSNPRSRRSDHYRILTITGDIKVSVGVSAYTDNRNPMQKNRSPIEKLE